MDEIKTVSSLEGEEVYEAPELIDYGSLSELTQSGSQPLSEGFGGAAAGGGS
jgi:hypothetical protein